MNTLMEGPAVDTRDSTYNHSRQKHIFFACRLLSKNVNIQLVFSHLR